MSRSLAQQTLLALLGAGFVLGFFAMASTPVGTDVAFTTPWNNHTAGELHFWVCWLLLLLPGTLLVGAALAPSLADTLATRVKGLGALPAEQQRTVWLLVFAVGLCLAALGRAVVLLDHPVTDDEPAARLGGQILATGNWTLPLPEAWSSLPKLFLYVNHEAGTYTSVDWIGVQLAWAISEWTNSGSAIFALAAALPAPFVGFALARRLGFAWGVLGAGMLLLSPMAIALSFTTHAHVLSRAWLAVGLSLYVLASMRGGDGGARALRLWLGCGLFLGLAFMTRPFETGTLCAPLGLLVLFEAARNQPGRRQALVGIVLGALLPIGLLAYHNAMVTGSPFLPARFDHDTVFTGLHRSPFSFLADPSVLWDRFGNNLSYNLMQLVLWFMGPLGLIVVVMGMGIDRLTRALGLGVGANLLLALLHDDAGLHIVGPIHYSETVVPLTFLAVHGLQRAHHALVAWCDGLPDAPAWRGRFSTVATAVGLASVLALGVFSLWHARGMRAQAEIHETIYAAVDELGLENAVLVSPPYWAVWRTVPHFRETGSWVFEWPPVAPGSDAPVIFVHEEGEDGDVAPAVRMQRLREAFPGRSLYALVGVYPEGRLQVEPIALGHGGGASQRFSQRR